MLMITVRANIRQTLTFKAFCNEFFFFHKWIHDTCWPIVEFYLAIEAEFVNFPYSEIQPLEMHSSMCFDQYMWLHNHHQDSE